MILKLLVIPLALISMVSADLTNVAHADTGAVASQSSNYDNGNYPASIANNGNLNGWAGKGEITHTNQENEPWWKVTLPEMKIISSVKVYNREDSNQGRLQGFVLTIYNSVGDEVYSSADSAADESKTTKSMYSFDIADIVGDVVKVELPGNSKFLSLAEVQVFGKDTTYNVALADNEAVASQSSNYEDGGAASIANDGNPNGDWGKGEITHTKEENSPWWKVTLPEMKTISSVKVYNREDSNQDRLQGFVLTISNSDGEEVYSSADSAADESKTTKSMYSFDIADIVGDVVTVELPGNTKFLSLAEVQVWGSNAITLSPTVDTNMVLAVGEGKEGRPHGKVGPTIVPLTIVTYFEAHESLFERVGGIDEAITIEVYANVLTDENDCTTGTLLETVEGVFDITTESKQYDNYNTDYADIIGSDYPVSSNGKVGSATVIISDFQYTPTDVKKQIWFPSNGDKGGEVKLCIVTAIKIDYDEDDTGYKEYYVSHMDSKRTLSIDLVGSFEDQVIDITESKATDSKTDAVLYVAVDTFLCNNKHEQVPSGKKYASGQDFRICVGPTSEGVVKGYEVDNYIELICGGRTLINAGVVDALTAIDLEYKNDKLAARSVLTAMDAIDGTASITCTGKVSFSYTATDDKRALRDLQTSTGLVPSGGVEADELLEGLFEVNIEMDTPSNESSSAPLPSSMTTTVAVIGVGSILSFVSSMIW